MAAANAHYYATRDPLGATGDFTTAPEISQMFGELIGAALAEAWTGAGSPTDAIYAELGPGRGTLAADALRVMRRAGFAGEVHFVETSPALRDAQAAKLPDAHFPRPHRRPPAAPAPARRQRILRRPPRRAMDRRRTAPRHSRRHLASPSPSTARSAKLRHDATPPPPRSPTHLARHGGAALIIDYGYAGGEQGDTLQAVRGHAFADPLDVAGRGRPHRPRRFCRARHGRQGPAPSAAPSPRAAGSKRSASARALSASPRATPTRPKPSPPRAAACATTPRWAPVQGHRPAPPRLAADRGTRTMIAYRDATPADAAALAELGADSFTPDLRPPLRPRPTSRCSSTTTA